jgi:hypothetical protein
VKKILQGMRPATPKESKVPTTNQTLHTFYDGTLSTKKKRFIFQQ